MSNQERKVITTSAVLAMLQAGQTRQEIKEHFELTTAELTAVFQSPSLKNKRTHISKAGIQIVDDITDGNVVAPVATPATSAEVSPAPVNTDAAPVPAQAPATAPSPDWNTPAELVEAKIEQEEAPAAEWTPAAAEEVKEDRAPFDRSI